MARFARSAGVLALAIVLSSACGSSTGTATPSVPGGQPGTPSVTPAASSSVPASAGVVIDTSPVPASSPGPSGSIEPGDAAPSALPTGAAGCSGSHDNRVFFDAIAGQVTWAVYCAVLPDGWFVQAGSFSLRGGGRMEITYHGPDGMLLTLVEGNVCEGQSGDCAAPGQEIGQASLGDQQGTLVRLDSGPGYAIDVSPGSFPGWTVTGTGMDQATFTAIAAALLHVAG